MTHTIRNSPPQNPRSESFLIFPTPSPQNLNRAVRAFMESFGCTLSIIIRRWQRQVRCNNQYHS